MSFFWGMKLLNACVPNVLGLVQHDGVLGDVFCVIGNPLKALADHGQVAATLDVFGGFSIKPVRLS